MADEIKTDDQLTKLTVMLVPRSLAALETAASLTGDTQTDTVNRALQVYACVSRMGAEGGGEMLIDWTPGRQMRLVAVPEPVAVVADHA